MTIILIMLVACSNIAVKKEFPLRLVPLSEGERPEDHETFGQKYVISTQGKHSSHAGAKMFKLGGNIYDAAVAISFAIAVERPQSTGLGGGGFMLFFDAAQMKTPKAIDFREKAPLRAHKNMFLDKNLNEIPMRSREGIFAAGVPGMVAGVLEIHKKYGKLPLPTVLQPAIDLAKNGFLIYPGLSRALKKKRDLLGRNRAAKKIFFNKKGEILKKGDRLIQSDLADTLTIIAKQGRKGFYRGNVAQAIILDNLTRGGLITQQDFKLYDVKYREPIAANYKGYTLYLMPPPSSGGVHIAQILNILEEFDLKEQGIFHPQTVHLTASAMQMAFFDRAKYLGDTDFVKVPVKGLTSKKYAQVLRQEILPNHSRPQGKIENANPFPYESDETTHFSIMDGEGNSIVSTQTINGWFGSGIVVAGTGILLNNEMDDFSTKVGASNLFGAVGGINNLVSPQKRPLSSMSPTLVFKDNAPILAVGTPSGTRILTCVAQTILNYIEYKLPLYEAVAAIRYHHQWSPDEIRVDEPGLPPQSVARLEKMGYKVRMKNLGCKIQAVAMEANGLHGVSDPRGQGMSLGE